MPTEISHAFEDICDRYKLAFPAISTARQASNEIVSKLATVAINGKGPLPSIASLVLPDTSIVVFGSLARREWTHGSDVDWTLLVDGQADPQHRPAAQEFAKRLRDSDFRGPGPAGVFGSVSFSHELIHCIGGELDSNTNLTRRILLLLESASLSEVDAHSRVVRGILRRYIESERSFLAETGRKYKVPRFLFNDIVRYWRTMAVDYVSKQWERGDEGWALRNMKLRFSRKLLFVSGLLMCYSCYLDQVPLELTLFKDQTEAAQAVQRLIVERLGTPPIDMLCWHLNRHARPETAQKVLSAYDAFLHAMNDPESRTQLSTLHPEESYSDRLFNELRQEGHYFQEGLLAMFYEDSLQVKDLMLKYGVF